MLNNGGARTKQPPASHFPKNIGRSNASACAKVFLQPRYARAIGNMHTKLPPVLLWKQRLFRSLKKENR